MSQNKTAMMQLESEINEVIEDLEVQIKQSDENDWKGLLTARMKIYESVNARINQLIIGAERQQIEAAHHDGYIQAGEDGYNSEHGPKVHNPVSSEQYYTETYNQTI